MRRLSKLPLRLKVLAMTVGVASMGLVIGALLMLADQRHSARQALSDSAVARARTVAAYLAGPLAFDDPEGARELLGQLASDPMVKSAALYDADGHLFAAFTPVRTRPAPASLPRTDAWSGFRGERLDTYQPVRLADRQIGSLYIASSARALEVRMRRSTLITASVCALLVAICGLIALRLQRFITEPVQRLASAMGDISRGGALTVRVQNLDNQDELSALFTGFNAMLDELHARGQERDAHAARLTSLLEASPDLVFLLDEDARPVEVLTPRHRLFAQDAQLRPEQLLREGMAPQAEIELKAAVRRALREWCVLRLEYAHRGESERWLEAVLVPLPDPAASAGSGRVLVSARDVSERRKLEAQLRQAQKLEAVGQLAGGIAHDFNNLLAGIIGYTELLRDRTDRESIHELADKVLETSERAADLVAGLLAFSRRGKREVKPIDLNELIVRVVHILEHTLDRRIEITLRLSPLPCHTEGDAAQLESALLNLAINARDAMPQGGKLTFSTQLVSDEGAERFVEIAVEDTGTGIEESVLAHIFEPFFTTKGPGKGSGLGLSAVYGTVQSHGGVMRVESHVGEGTVFRLYLPHSARDVIASVPPRRLSRGAGHILFVDDEDAVREAFSTLLRDLGYQVSTAKNGAEAVEQHRVSGERFDLTVLDMSMPGLGGPEAAAQIRALDPGARILLASGNSAMSEEELLRLSVDGFLQKPFRGEELSHKVAQLLESARTPAREQTGQDAPTVRGPTIN